MEFWNIGIMVLGMRYFLFKHDSCFDDRIKIESDPFKTTIPSFHYSIIP